MSKFKQLVEEVYTKEYNSFVKSVAGRLGEFKNHAEDAVQDGFTSVLTYEHAYKGTLEYKDIKSWCGMVIQNAAGKIANAERRQGTCDDDVVDEEGSHDMLDTIIVSEKAEMVKREMACRQSPWDEVLPLYFIDGLTSKECSDLHDVSAANVRKVAQRFKETMVQKYG